ncbi:MAG: glycolate oxidase binding subunit [Alphaproteobacteria bacterium]|jgi:glycolate oxidase FAD binding subunit|nr:glycolate oxidase binding subunit [Alphaproteobacteria bacterium]
MTDTLKSRDAKEVEDALRWALDGEKSLELVGRGSKCAMGRPSQTELTLDLSSLTGVTVYEPEELVLSARAGTPIAEIEALVASKGQQLAFEPMDYGPVLAKPLGEGTIGGVLAANLSGPRRIKAGAARDHFLGFHAVSGRGEAFKSGGRVVKNVTGYDLCKLLAGSWGTLAAMTDVTVKTLPKAETEETLLVLGLTDAAAIKAMTAAMGSPCEVSGAAHLPATAALRVAGHIHRMAITAFRLEGVAPSVTHRKLELESLMRAFGELDLMAEDESQAFWRAVRDVLPFAATGNVERPLWRISTAPSKGAEVATAIAAQAGAQAFYDWGGGLVWIELLPAPDAGAAIVRQVVAAAGGHATLVRAPPAVRAAVPVFSPQEPALAALSKRVKESFDPKGILNAGRMWAGV